MSSTSHKDFACLLNIKDAIEKIEFYVSGYSNADEFNDDSRSFDATMMNFLVIGVLNRLLMNTMKNTRKIGFLTTNLLNSTSFEHVYNNKKPYSLFEERESTDFLIKSIGFHSVKYILTLKKIRGM